MTGFGFAPHQRGSPVSPGSPAARTIPAAEKTGRGRTPALHDWWFAARGPAPPALRPVASPVHGYGKLKGSDLCGAGTLLCCSAWCTRGHIWQSQALALGKWHPLPHPMRDNTSWWTRIELRQP